ncbi:MAG: thermonuclease family protein [Candidatus Omnitrophota bacterium]|nr:thermonuclease family protein [Candidatus Omnitrophota bacterium]
MKELLLAFSLLFAACTPELTTKPSEVISNYNDVGVLEVIDGDTIKLADGKLLRYIGIDTPETRIKKGNRFIYSPQPGAVEATTFNKSLVSGKKVRIEFDVQKTDKYGRLLGYCYVGDTFVNARLIEEGYAVLLTYPPNVKYADLFVKLQKQAREARRGLWGAYAVIDHAQAHRFINQVRTVRGTVLNTHLTKKCMLLNFGSNYKDDFTIVIFANSYRFFEKAGIDPLTFYKGKTVQATGRIRSYNGPEIIANGPLDIEVVGASS